MRHEDERMLAAILARTKRHDRGFSAKAAAGARQEIPVKKNEARRI